jgi:hypothetical protein
MTASSRRGAALFFACLLLPLVARADPPTAPPTEDQVEAGKALYHEARELHRAGKWKEAVAKALDAYKAAPTPVTALQAATFLVEGGRLVEARDLARAVTQLPASPRESDKGREARTDAASLAATLDSRIPKIALAARPANVDVTLDARPLTVADASAWQGVDPGVHTMIVRAGDRICTTISVTLAEGEARTIDLHDVTSTCRPSEPAPIEAAPHPVAGPVPPPLATPPLPPVDPVRTSGHAEAGGLGPRQWAGIALGGLGLVAVGVGGYLALDAKSSYDGVAGDCPPRGCTSSAFDVRNGARSQADVATGVMVVGGGAAVAGAVLFFLGRSERSATTGASKALAILSRVAVGPRDVRVTLGFP